MKRKLLSMLVLLMTAVSGAWGQSRLYLEVNPGNNTATLKYGSVQGTTPYYVGGDDNVWSVDPAKSSVTTITVDESCQYFAGESLYRLFSGFTALTTINGLTNLYTANVTDMGGMFEGCSLLTSLDLSSWNTGSVTDMSYMFSDCSQLPSLDLSGWNTSMVTDMSGMFYDCENLESLDVSGWNTAEVTDMEEMFKDCSSLPSLDLSGWNTAKVTDMSGMFFGCSSLASLDLSGWNTAKVTYMNDMFNGCSSLASLDLSGWNTANVTKMNDMFRDCSSLASLDLSGWNTAKVNDMSGMFWGCSNLENIYVGDGWSTKKVNNTWSSNMFSGCTKLPNWDETTDKTHANTGAGGYLTSWTQENLYLYLKVNSDNKAVLRYGQVPANTPYYDGNNQWVGDGTDAAKNRVTDITVEASCQHFAGESLYSFFNGFSALTTINNLENLNTGSVTNMSYMFRNCSSLASLDLSGWNTAKVTNMVEMFYSCRELPSLDLSGWNTESVTDMAEMFYYCRELASLDVSGWNTAKVTYMIGMFFGCPKLEAIYVGDGWSTDKVTSSDDMFKGCTKLPNFNPAVVDKTHANTGAGGYLTMKLQAHEGAKGEFWATFYSAISNYQAPEGTQVFTVNLDGTSITMKEIGDGIVESGQGVVLKASTADGINLTPTDKTATGDFSDNSLQGTATSITNPGNAYVLNYKEGTGAGFYKLSSTGTIGANKAYLTYGSPAQEEPVGAPAFFSFDNTTGIVEMRNCGNEGNEWNEGNGENAIWYDLNGRRLQGKPAQKGLYIVNGKKVIIK